MSDTTPIPDAAETGGDSGAPSPAVASAEIPKRPKSRPSRPPTRPKQEGSASRPSSKPVSVVSDGELAPRSTASRPNRPQSNLSEASNDTADAPSESPTSVPPEEQSILEDARQKYKLGLKVEVEGYSCPGTVRFVGIVGGICRVGIALDKPYGKNNGAALGTQFFQCLPNHGTFVYPKKLKAIEGEPLTVVPGQRVHVDSWNADGLVHFRGYINGRDKVGIELDEKRGKNNGSVLGSKYFECAQYHGIFAEVDKVHIIG